MSQTTKQEYSYPVPAPTTATSVYQPAGSTTNVYANSRGGSTATGQFTNGPVTTTTYAVPGTTTYSVPTGTTTTYTVPGTTTYGVPGSTTTTYAVPGTTTYAVPATTTSYTTTTSPAQYATASYGVSSNVYQTGGAYHKAVA